MAKQVRKDKRVQGAASRGGGEALRLTALEQKIIAAVNKYGITCPNLLVKQLAQSGRDENIHHIRTALDRLSRDKYLMKLELAMAEARAPVKVFALGKYGKDYLRTIGKTPSQTKLDDARIKELLTVQQYLIRAGHIAEAQEIVMTPTVTEEVKPGYHTDCCFRAHAVVQTKDRHTQIVEVVRDDMRAMEELCQKLQSIQRTVLGQRKLNMPLYRPDIVLVCETPAHQKAVEAILRQSNCEFQFPLYLTNDAQTYGNPVCRYSGEIRTETALQ